MKGSREALVHPATDHDAYVDQEGAQRPAGRRPAARKHGKEAHRRGKSRIWVAS